MKLKDTIGDHKIYSYDSKIYNFVDFVKKLFNCDNLQELHKTSSQFKEFEDRLELGVLNDTQTDLHDIFYEKIKADNDFKELYCKFVKHIYEIFFPNEKYILYQSFPSIRIQFPQSITVPAHKDSDSLSNLSLIHI